MTCVTEIFENGESVIVTVVTTNCSDVRANVDSIVIKILSPTGTVLVDDVAMTNPAVGLYTYTYSTPPTEGIYRLRIATVSSGKTTKEKTTFTVVGEI